MLDCGNANVVSTTGIGISSGSHSIGIGIGVNVLQSQNTGDDDAEDSDVEISKIDFRGVNLRTKKKRDVPGNQAGEKIGDVDAEDGNGCYDGNDISQQQPERPMSWEGELSDQEMSSNTITNQVGVK